MKKKLSNGGVIDGDAAVIQRVADDFELQRARGLATRERWGEDNGAPRMTKLCHAFPTLRGVPGTDPWNAMVFLRWLCTSGAVTTGSRFAGQFVLQVWNPTTDWAQVALAPAGPEGLGLRADEVGRLEPFNLVRALAHWDSDHEDALRSWVELPFWP